MTTLQQTILTAALDASSRGLISGTSNWAAFVATSISAALAQQGQEPFDADASYAEHLALNFTHGIATPAPQAQPHVFGDGKSISYGKPAQQVSAQGERELLITRLTRKADAWDFLHPTATRPNVCRDAVNYLQSTQPVQPLTEPEIHALAHRKATNYKYTAKSSEVMYGFSEGHLLDFVRAIKAAS